MIDEKWMIDNWGVRCSEYQQGCALCEAWRAFYYLIDKRNGKIFAWKKGKLVVDKNEWKKLKDDLK